MGICVSSRAKNQVSPVGASNLILNMPPEEMFCRGVTVRIQCTGIPVTSQDVKWFKDGVPIPTNSSEKSVLCLEELKLSDGGKYRCEITQSSGAKISSNEVDISIKDKQVIKLSVEKNLLFEGAKSEIRCESTLSEATKICWQKDATEILIKGKYSNGTCKNPSLTISDLQKSDSGTYKCKIINTFGFAEDSIYLDVKEQEAPSVEEIIKLVQNGTKSTFSTSAIVSNLPEIIDGITTFKNSQRICVLSITNNSRRKLSNPKLHVEDGRKTLSVESIDDGKVGLFIFTTEGTLWHIRTDGVLTFDVEGTDKQIAILWSVPFSLWNKNQFAIRIRPQGSIPPANSYLYKYMLQNAPYTGTEIVKETDGYKITATMSKDSKAHLCLNLEITD
ncbi:hemicentin-2-like [Ostrea edulis]|uniref:hemicentin-2-like n=1 Tax=Ostrea edulis TaxID=37623 RepID=UPI0024AFCFE2|nr:hemicentin-2-like [Ostrea edulis]